MADKSRENQDEAVATYFRTILLLVQKADPSENEVICRNSN